MIFFLLLSSMYVIAYENLVIPDHDRPPIQVQLPRTGSTVPLGPPFRIRVEGAAFICDGFSGEMEGLVAFLKHRFGAAYVDKAYYLVVAVGVPYGQIIRVVERLHRAGIRHLRVR